jgi:hypothetical protein
LSEPRRYLFVITRDLCDDPSAQYMLRRALGACRRGAAVTVVLRDRATSCLARAGDLALVARLLSSGVTIFVQYGDGEQPGGTSNLVDAVGVRVATLSDEELADLLLDAAVEAHWC